MEVSECAGILCGVSKLFAGDGLLYAFCIFVLPYLFLYLHRYYREFRLEMKFIKVVQDLREKPSGSSDLAFDALLTAVDLKNELSSVGESPERPEVQSGERAAGLRVRLQRYLKPTRRMEFGPKHTRLYRGLRFLIRNFATIPLERHYTEGIRPSARFLKEVDDGPDVDINLAYNNLIRISLALTFLGVAAVLYLAGQGLGSIANEQAVSRTAFAGPVLDIINASSTKFWITAIGYLAGNIMLFAYQRSERVRILRVNKLSEIIDQILSDPHSHEYVRTEADEFSSVEKQRLHRILSDNIEKITAMGQEVNDNLIAKIGSIATDTKEVSDAIIDNVATAFADLRDQGIRVPVHEALSEQFGAIMETLVYQVGAAVRSVEEVKKHLAAKAEESERDTKLIAELAKLVGALTTAIQTINLKAGDQKQLEDLKTDIAKITRKLDEVASQKKAQRNPKFT